jgi:electron transport complex protein RnfD
MTWFVAASLLPAAAWGIFLFGLPAALVLVVAVLAALLAELLSTLPFHRFTLDDGSAFLTGLLVGSLMPAGVPLYVPASASVFAILVVKQSFGGLGSNWLNPALGGIVFANLSWSGAMSRWLTARGMSSNAAAVPPLEALRSLVDSGAAPAGSPLEALSVGGYRFSALDERILSWVNDHLLAPLGVALAPGSFDVLVGHVPGLIGAVSPPLLLAGAWFLLRRRIVSWQVPVAYVSVFAILALVFGGLSAGLGWLAGGPVFNILSGSLLLGAFYMASDPVTSPLSREGKWMYGTCLGVLTFALRYYGSLGDGVAVSILLGNCAVPLIDRHLRQRATAPQRGRIG